MPRLAAAGWDYVIVAREAALTRPFEALLDDLSTALVRVTRQGPSPPGRRQPVPATQEREGP